MRKLLFGLMLVLIFLVAAIVIMPRPQVIYIGQCINHHRGMMHERPKVKNMLIVVMKNNSEQMANEAAKSVGASLSSYLNDVNVGFFLFPSNTTKQDLLQAKSLLEKNQNVKSVEDDQASNEIEKGLIRN